jgi:hypothetical protein
MGRWADRNNSKVTDAILEMNSNPDAALKKLQRLADEAVKHDRADAEVMRDIVENHRYLAS